jgi:hypothetical protein
MKGVTDVLAIYGAALSTVAVVWNLYRNVHDRRRELRKKLTAELYAPMRRQLTEAAEAIHNDQRAHSINTETWRVASASGITKKVKSSLSSILAELYERTLPSYDKAWQVLNEEIGRMAQEWDRKYADIHDFQAASKEYSIVKIDWWKFLTSDGPVTPTDGLRDGNVLRLWNSFMTPARFKLLDRSPEQFLIERWHEAARNDTLKQFRELRRLALEDIPRAIALLDRNSLY